MTGHLDGPQYLLTTMTALSTAHQAKWVANSECCHTVPPETGDKAALRGG